MKQQQASSTSLRESGQALVLFVLAAAALMGFMAFAIDVGVYMHERRSHQNAADAASLAGVVELPGNPATASQQARQWVLNNGYSDQDIQSISVSTTYTTNDTLTVNLKSNFDWIFARALSAFGADDSEGKVTARAAARVASPAAAANLEPWAVLESAINWSGGSTVLKYDSQHPSNGNFGALAIDGTGANVYRDTIENGSVNSLCAQGQPGCSDPTATTEPGNMTGPTRTGVSYLMSNTSSACDSFAEAFRQRPDGTYDLTPRCNPWSGATDSKRVVMTPVITSLCNGRCSVTIKYFAIFFLDTLDACTGNNCQITGHFAKVMANPGATLGELDSHGAIRAARLVE